MIRVYVAGPMDGDGSVPRRESVNKAIAVAHELLLDGWAPFVPHLNDHWEERHSVPRDIWLAYDIEWLKQCQVLLRLPGVSKGSDGEVQFAIVNSIPVFYSIETLREWRAQQS